MWLIKLCENTILDPLMRIINQSLITEKLKEENPVFKGGDEVISIFRPICLLQTFSKIFQSVVKEQLMTLRLITCFQLVSRDSEAKDRQIVL